ncbi:MAG: YihY/virulence factor BrkB family protein [Gammaproteobacteria bacterium]|nr:YihY/virulence factor BrkB family protein [Gammaproteobacteria bacterium]
MVLWQTELDQLPHWQRFAIKLVRIFQAVARDLSEGLITLRAMSLVYTTLLAMIPVLAVGFSVLKGFGLHNRIAPLLSHLLEPLGDESEKITLQIINFVDNIDVALLGVMGIGMLFYTVITLINKIERAFNHTWHITEFRGLAQRVSEYLSIIMIGPILIFAALTLTAGITSSTLFTALSDIALLEFIFNTIGIMLPYLLVITAFTAIYLLVPNTRVKFSSAFTGALIAGILWETTGWLFANFIATSSNYTVVYSGFAMLVLFMVWIYLSWLILLIGAAIAYYHQHPDKIPAARNPAVLSIRMKEKLALLAMYHIGKNFHENRAPCTASGLADELNIPSDALTEILHGLDRDKLIIRHEDQNISYLPAQSLENILLIRILESIRRHGETKQMNSECLHSEKVIDDLIGNVYDAVTEATGQRTLRDLISTHPLDHTD